VGNASLALSARESGVGDPPKSKPSNGDPTRELRARSETIAGTLRPTIRKAEIVRFHSLPASNLHGIFQPISSEINVSYRNIFGFYEPSNEIFNTVYMRNQKTSLGGWNSS
jgi:hypothetical protein